MASKTTTFSLNIRRVWLNDDGKVVALSEDKDSGRLFEIQGIFDAPLQRRAKAFGWPLQTAVDELNAVMRGDVDPNTLPPTPDA